MQEVKLGTLTKRKIGYGIVQPGSSVTNGVPVIKVNNIISGLRNVHVLDTTSIENDRKYFRTKLVGGELIVSVVGTIGKTAIVPQDFAGCNLVRATALIDIPDTLMTRWVKYYIDSPKGQYYIHKNLNTTVQPTLNVKSLVEMPVPLFSADYMMKATSIMAYLDDKIAVNKKICENLEAQAQALFKNWFVDFAPFKDGKFVESELGLIPEGWRVVSLDEMTSKFGTGLNPRQNFKLGEGDNYYVTIKNMGNNRVYLDGRCDKVTDEAIEKINKRSKLQKGDLLFSGIGTIGRVAMITETPTNWNTSESVFNMHPAEGYSTEFLYVLLLSDAFQQYVKIHAQGGVQQGIRMASLKQYLMPVPDHNTLKTFDDIVVSIISQIREKDKENDYLSTLRDTLLPKLMSGQIKL